MDKVRAGLYEQRICVIHREKDAQTCRDKVHAAAKGGLSVQEITLTTPSALKLIREFRREKLGTIGAGSILTVAEARKAVDAGAQFLVSPVFVKSVWNWCKRKKVLFIPGCATPQEIYAAWLDGCRPIKVFPAPTVGGPEFVKRILGPMPFLEILPTAVGHNDVKPYLKVGARAVGIGAAFTHATEDSGKLSKLAARVLKAARPVVR